MSFYPGDTIREIISFLDARAEVKGTPAVVFESDFRKRHKPTRFSIAEAVYASICAQVVVLPINFALIQTPDVWEVNSGVAVLNLALAIFGVFGPILYTIVNVGLAKGVSWVTPKKFRETLASGRASDVWLYLEGAHGFWGRVAFAVLFSLYISVATLGSQNSFNEAYIERYSGVEAWVVAGAVLAFPIFLGAVWVWSSVMDGTLQMTSRYIAIVMPKASLTDQVWFWIKCVVLMGVWRVWPLNYVVLIVVFGASFVFALCAYQLGHLFRYAVGLEAVGFVDLNSVLSEL